MLGDDAIISSDFGGNPPYEKMKEVARICSQALAQADQRAVHHRRQVEQHRHLRDLRAMADALREHFSQNGPTPLYVVIGRGGPNLVRGMGALRDTAKRSACRTSIFGFDSDISEVIQYARAADAWMRAGGREQVASDAQRRHDEPAQA